MFIVQVFRPESLPEYDGRTEAYEAWEKNPFEGIEILGFCNTEAEVNALIDAYDDGKRKFHYEPITSHVLTALKGEG